MVHIIVIRQQLKGDGMRAHDVLAAWVWACEDLDDDLASAGREALGCHAQRVLPSSLEIQHSLKAKKRKLRLARD